MLTVLNLFMNIKELNYSVIKKYIFFNKKYYGRIGIALAWVVMYLFAFELLVNINHSVSSDLIYIESLYRDIFIADYSITGWLVSKAPYYFPDWVLYSIIRVIAGNYLTSWYIYVFINFILIILFLYLTLRYFYLKEGYEYILFSLMWGLGLVIILKSSPSGYGPHTFLFPVYHSGALLNGLIITLAWLYSFRKKLTNVGNCILIIFLIISTMSDLWFVMWFVIPIILTISILVYLKKISLKNHLNYLIITVIGTSLGSVANKFLEKLGYLHFSNVKFGDQQVSYFQNIHHLLGDIVSLFISSPLLLVFFSFNIILTVVNLWMLLVSKSKKKNINNEIENKIEFIALQLVAFISFFGTILAIAVFKIWGGWNYRYLHPLLIFPWVICGLYVFEFFKKSKILIKLCIIIPLITTIYIFTYSFDSSFKSLRRGVPLEWINPPYHQEMSCIDNAAKIYNLKYGVSEYWSAKWISELNRSGLLVNQFDYNINPLHWMNNIEWYRDTTSKKNYVNYDFIATENTGGDEFKKNIKKYIGPPTFEISCGVWNLFVYKNEKGRHLNNFIKTKLDSYFKIENNIGLKNISLFSGNSYDSKNIDQWHFYPGKKSENFYILPISKEEKNIPLNIKEFIHFEIRSKPDFAYIERHLKVDEISGKSIKLVFYARSPNIGKDISSIGYMVPKGKLDESAIFFMPSQGSPFKLTAEWSKVQINFTVPLFEKHKQEQNSYILIRPIFLTNMSGLGTIDITGVNIFIEDTLKAPDLGKGQIEGNNFNYISQYISLSDYYDLNREILKEFESIKSIEQHSISNSEILWRLSRVHMRLADLASDREEWKTNVITAANYAWKAINKDSNVNTLKWWGITAEALGKIEGRRQHIEGGKILNQNLIKAIELEPSNPELYYLLARWNIDWIYIDRWWSSENRGSYENSKNLLVKAIKIDPYNALYRLSLALTLINLGDKDWAQNEYTHAKTIGFNKAEEIAISEELKTRLAKE